MVWSWTGPLTSELQDSHGSEGLVTLSQRPLDSERQATWPSGQAGARSHTRQLHEPGPSLLFVRWGDDNELSKANYQ